jgi:SpoIID/LytB domain protein
VTTVRFGVRKFQRIRREHALILACACVLFFNFPSARFNPAAVDFRGGDSARDEAAIDSALQQAATDALGNREGTVIVMDTRTGRVRAIVNPPAAYSEGLMPGSAIKPFTALAALRAGLIDENSRTVCPGRFTGLSFSLPCVHADHLPPFNPAQAIAYSCNYYFATLGQRLGRDRLIAILREFDFGQRTGISDREAAGILRPCETGNSARLAGIEANHYAAQADCTAREGVGESDNLQVTPVQLLSAYAALINGGHLYEPKVAGATDFQPVERSTINIASEHRAIIIDGMAGAIRYGTARSAKLDTLPLTIIGKTGTANPAKGFRANGWFIGFAGPFESNRELEPAQVDLAVLVLLARAHGSQAAETARPVFAAYANEIERTGSQARSVSGNDRRQPDKNVSASSRLAASNSTVRVHLVSGNITKELSLEDYVLGVMRAEGTMETEPEGLKALAIAIRTYALKNMGRHAKDGYDFCSTTHCQRFVEPRSSPTVSERPLIAAVQATEGQVLLDDHGQLIDAYFGASCGGETANIGSLWGITPPEYLRGERDEYCETGPHAKWTDTISRADLLRALQSDSRTDPGNRLDHLTVSQRDETGRAEFITLEGEHRKTVRGWDFKIIVGRVLGWNVLKSSRFEVSRSGSNFVFRGSGFGHGLGLCQEGAHVMAQRGASYEKILEKYFPGTRVMPRSGSLSLARPFKAGTNDERNQIVASATTDLTWFQSSLTRPQQWRADVFPALKGSAKLMRSFAALLTGEARFLTISSEHFRVTYPTDVERRDADQVLTTLESARSDYLRRASASVSINIPTLEIRLNESTGDFTSRTGQPWWAAAATKGNRIELQPLRILKQRGVLFTTLRHELAHVVIDAASRNQVSRWLGEGFAIYLAGEGSTISRYATKTKVTDDELERKLERPGSQSEMRMLYAAAYEKVVATIQSDGESHIWKRIAGS